MDSQKGKTQEYSCGHEIHVSLRRGAYEEHKNRIDRLFRKTPSSKGPTIILAEPDDEIFRRLRRYLKRTGFRVDRAADMERGVERIFTTDADYLLINTDEESEESRVLAANFGSRFPAARIWFYSRHLQSDDGCVLYISEIEEVLENLNDFLLLEQNLRERILLLTENSGRQDAKDALRSRVSYMERTAE